MTWSSRARARFWATPSPPSSGTTKTNRRSRPSASAAASLRSSLISASLFVVRLAITSVVSKGEVSSPRSVMRCSTGMSTASSMRSTKPRRSHPELTTGSVEMMMWSGRYSATMSMVAVYGSGSPTSPIASMPSSRSTPRARSTRTCAASKTESA